MAIILDAFDECGDSHSRKPLVHLHSTHLPQLPNRFRFLVTSRPELDQRVRLPPSNQIDVIQCCGMVEWVKFGDPSTEVLVGDVGGDRSGRCDTTAGRFLSTRSTATAAGAGAGGLE